VYFMLKLLIQELSLVENTKLMFEYSEKHPITVTIRSLSLEEQANGHKANDAICLAESQRQPSQKVRAMFDDLRKILESGEGSDSAHYRVSSDATSQKVGQTLWERLPQPLQSFAGDVYNQLYDYALRTTRVLRWRQGMTGPHRPLSYLKQGWSFDDVTYYAMPIAAESHLEIIPSRSISEDARSAVERLVMAGRNEPLGHELYREAWQQRHENPRSALLLGISAAEVGLKQCIGELVPDAQWLVDNLPSPPLATMLRDYLPQLPARRTVNGKVVPPPKDILDIITIGVGLRNRIAHSAGADLTYRTLERILLAVYDVLWMLDYYCGFDWAVNYVRPDVRAGWLSQSP
jgi:hypothetical protein